MKAKFYPKSVSEKFVEKILEQMKKSFYKVFKNDGKTELGLGFFSQVKCYERYIPVLVLNSLVLYYENIDTIKVSKNNVKSEIKLGDIKIKNKVLNITVIEIEEKQNDKIYFLELENRLYKKDLEDLFENESIYTIQYFKTDETYSSFGTITTVNNSTTFKLLCDININSKFSIIFKIK